MVKISLRIDVIAVATGTLLQAMTKHHSMMGNPSF
jgi:hypothetical protein